jgi:hypothetical protein
VYRHYSRVSGVLTANFRNRDDGGREEDIAELEFILSLIQLFSRPIF